MANNLNFFRGEYSKFLELVNSQQVDSTNLYFTVPDTTPKEEVKDDKKSSSFCVFHGTNLLASATHEADLNKVIGDVSSLTERINNISSELATYTISAVTVVDKNVKEAYQLIKTVGETSEGVGDVIKVYNDSALNNVELITKTENKKQTQFLKFTYTLEDGSSKDVEFDVSSLLVQSEFKNGLLVNENGEVSVKLGDDIKNNEGDVTSKNFLTFEGNVDGEKALAVRSIDTNKTVLQKEIKVAGLNGTLGTGNYKNGDTIAVGTDIYTILQNILSQEIYPTLTNSNYKTAAITSAIKAPTITLSKTNTQIYGTDVTLSVSCSDLVVSTTPNEVNGLTNGYSDADDDSADSTNTKITKNVSSAITDANYTLSATFTGFTSQANLTKTGETSVCKFDKQALGKVTMGDNTVSITITGPIVSGHADSISSGYTVSNLGNTDSGKTYSGKSAYDRTLSRPTSGSSATVTGVLPCFANVSNGALVDTPAQLSLTTGKEFTITVPSENVAKKHFMFDFPADRTVSSFKVKDLQGNFVAFEAAYTQSTEVEKTINGFTMKYKRLTTTGDYVGDGVYKITLSTNLNSADMSKVLKNNNQ
jgi:hypothetical protein